MIQLIRVPGPAQGIRYPADVAGMQKILADAGYEAHPIDIQWAWGEYSEDEYCAGWLMPHIEDPKSAPWILAALLKYLVPQDKEA
jgi:hypothetical protein